MAPNPIARSRRLRAVIVDDDAEMRTVLTRFLTKIGVDISCEFEDAASALKGLETIMPDFIVMDLALSPKDAVAFVRQFRSSNRVRDNQTPIIAVTGYTYRHHVEAARDAGISDFLSRSVTLGVLRRRIEAIRLQTRAFIRSANYIGPCRRRKRARDGSAYRRRSDVVEI